MIYMWYLHGYMMYYCFIDTGQNVLADNRYLATVFVEGYFRFKICFTVELDNYFFIWQKDKNKTQRPPCHGIFMSINLFKYKK